MKQIKLLFLATVFMTSNSIGQIFQPNDFADKILITFQTKNFADYRQLVMTSTDYKEFLNDFFKNNNIPKSEQKQFEDKEKLFADSADIQIQKDFDSLIIKGVNLGIEWTQIKKAKFVFKVDKPIDSDKKTLTGHLNFIYKDTTFVLFGIEAIEFTSGYKISSIRTVLKGGIEEFVDPDSLDDEDM